MSDGKGARGQGLLRQAARFIGLSGLGWLLDFTIYTLLSLRLSNLAMNNIISSLAGASFVFAFSTRFVFQDSHRIPLGWKYFIYIAYQLALIFLISELLAYINGLIAAGFSAPLILRFSAVIAKIIVTPITMTINFFAMKCVIEKL